MLVDDDDHNEPDHDGENDLTAQRAALGLAPPTPAMLERYEAGRRVVESWGPRPAPWRPPPPVPSKSGEPSSPRRVTVVPAVPGRTGNLNIRARGHVSDDADDYGPDAVQRAHWEIVANDRRLQNRRRWTARNNPAA